jgi:hypothetical protein
MIDKRSKTEKKAFESVMDLARERFNEGNIKAAIAYMTIADKLEEEIQKEIT